MAVISASATTGRSAPAQPRFVLLRPPSDTLAAEFTRVLGVRELSDGRVLIADAGEAQVVVGSFGRRGLRSIGRVGMGPREFPRVRTLLPLANDSTLMVDVVARRWTLFHADSVVRTVSTTEAAYQLTGGNVVSSDTLGHYLSLRPRAGERESFGDSTELLLAVPLRSTSETVSVLAPNSDRYLPGPADKDGRPASVRIVFPALSVAEQAVLAADGHLAVARLNPYRVDWRSPSGGGMRGGPLPFSTTRIDDAERAAVRRRLEAAGGRKGYPSDAARWPSMVPPFQNEALRISPEGHLLVQRTPTAKEPDTVYDVVDRQGRLVRRLAMSPAEHIVGFGRGTVFTVRRSEDGLETVRRHPWP